VAGSKGDVQIWDTSTNAAVRRTFAERIAPSSEPVKERLVGLEISDSESDEGEEPASDDEGGVGLNGTDDEMDE